MAPTSFLRWTGAALAAGGALEILVNVVGTPMLPRDVAFEVVAASPQFLGRQSASAIAAALLMFGSIGVHLAAAERTGRFAAVAFATALLGSALLLSWEWLSVFVIHELALREPSALRALEDAKGVTSYDLGAIIPITVFSLGWIALSIATYRACQALRRGAALVIVGFFAVPLLSAALGPIWGAAAANGVLGSGWILMGSGLIRTGR